MPPKTEPNLGYLKVLLSIIALVLSVIALVATLTFPLIGQIGDLMLDRMDSMAERQIAAIEAARRTNLKLNTQEEKLKTNIAETEENICQA